MNDVTFRHLVGASDLTRLNTLELYYLFKAEAGTLGLTRDEWRTLKQSFWFAAHAHHKTPRRESGESYLLHPLHMAISAIRDQKALGIKNIRIIQYCLLHDTIEEALLSGLSPVRLLRAIEFVFGTSMSDGVSLLTKEGSGIVSDQLYWAKLLCSLAWESLIAKLYDRIHNLETLGALPPPRQIAKIKETEEYIWRLITWIRSLVGVYAHTYGNDMIQKYHELVTILASRIRTAIEVRGYELVRTTS